MSKKSIYVTKASMPSYEEYIEAIKPLWESHILTNMGKYHNMFENQLTEYCGVPKVLLFSNGHMALELSLQAMNLSGEVITTPFTFASTTHAIVRNNLTPVFCDINEEDYTIDVAKIEALITDKTTAIVPVHVYGNICNVTEIERLAKKYDLKVIYDAAHAFGITIDGRNVATYGDASIFSFHATKAFNSIEGGAVAFSDTILGYNLYKLKNFGIMNETTIDGVGANAKMNEFQAIMGLCNMKHFDKNVEVRKNLVEHYRERLNGVDGIKISKEPADVSIKSNYTYFPVLFNEKKFCSSRNEICKKLNENNIFPRKYFYPLTNTFQCYHGKYNAEDTPVALCVSKRILTLPLYAELTIEEVDEICDIILNQ